MDVEASVLVTATAWSLLPPFLAIFCAIATRRTLTSLGLGIVVGGLLLNDFSPITSGLYIGQKIISLVWENGFVVTYVFIVFYLLILGIIAALMMLSGGVKAFSGWAIKRFKTERGVKLFASLLGVFLFIDDYFSCLVIGNVCRPITDKLKISRAKLAYIIDATSAPVTTLTPISSFGAYIISIIATILVSHQVLEINAFSAFVQIIFMNYYVLFAVALVVVVSYFNLQIGPMRQHDKLAKQGVPIGHDTGVSAGLATLTEAHHGRVRDLMIPLIVLTLATVIAFIGVGAIALQHADLAFGVIKALEYSEPAIALFVSGLVGLGVTLGLLMFKKCPFTLIMTGFRRGAQSMLPAICILLLAWLIAMIVSDLQTGPYLASLIDETLSMKYLPSVIFIIAGVVAFSTGSSWSTFALMLPIAADIALSNDPSLLFPVLAAVISGAIWGDHASPIADTTILSSAGAGCDHIEHVKTQLPYTLCTAGIALAGFLMLGVTASPLWGISAAGVSFLLCVGVMLWSVNRQGKTTVRKMPQRHRVK